MNRKKVIRIGLALIVIVLVLLTLHLGGEWLIETFKDMHGM